MEAPLLKSGHVPFVNAGRFIGDIYSGGESIGFRPTAVMNLSSFVGDYPGIYPQVCLYICVLHSKHNWYEIFNWHLMHSVQD